MFNFCSIPFNNPTQTTEKTKDWSSMNMVFSNVRKKFERKDAEAVIVKSYTSYFYKIPRWRATSLSL